MTLSRDLNSPVPPAPEQGERPKGIRVTVEDLATGERDSAVVWNDYMLVCAGSCYLAHTQAHVTGTHQLTIKGRS